MEKMQTTPRKALLMIHGILGAPSYFDFLRPYVPDGYDVYAPMLEGHGGSARQFGRASMRRWKAMIHNITSDLIDRYGSVTIVAHSMGTLFAIAEAVRRPEGVRGLLLLNPPLHLRLSRRLFATPMKIMTGRVREDDSWTMAAVRACSIEVDANPLHYLRWPARYIELFAEIRATRSIVPRLAVPTHAFYSSHDEMVSPGSQRLFPAAITDITLLPASGHYYYTPADTSAILAAFKEMTDNIL